jgi:predicted GIY-YIG superfamily endonuclease
MGSRGSRNDREHMPAFVYILRCRNGAYYTGSTRTSLELRVAEHDAGRYDDYTKRRRPVELVFAQEFERIEDAIAAERRIKGWSRAKKEALIAGDFEWLRERSRSGTGTASHTHPSTGSG